MKGVKLEDVTGEKAVRPEPVRRPATPGEAEVIGRPKTIEEQMDAAAGQAAWAIVACFGVGVWWLVFALIALAAGALVEGAYLLLAALVEAGCGWFLMMKRSRTASVVAIGLYVALAISALLFSFRPPSIMELIILGAMANGVTGVFTYHRLADQVKINTLSDDHIKDVFGDGDTAVKEGT